MEVKNECVLCSRRGSEALVNVGAKGLETLVRYSKIRCEERLEKLFCENVTVKVHATCIRDFTNDRRILSCFGSGESPLKRIKLRSQVTLIFFKARRKF